MQRYGGASGGGGYPVTGLYVATNGHGWRKSSWLEAWPRGRRGGRMKKGYNLTNLMLKSIKNQDGNQEKLGENNGKNELQKLEKPKKINL